MDLNQTESYRARLFSPTFGPFLLASAIGFTAGSSSTPEPLPPLVKFVDELPLLSHLKAAKGHLPELTISASQFKTKLHRDLPEGLFWGYNGSSPGPIVDVDQGQNLLVHWRNDLPTTHLFPLPNGADAIKPDVRFVTHLHGAEVTEYKPLDRKQNNDGWPDAWIVPGRTQLAEYPNDQSARMLWYHDHAMGETGRNVAAGLVGVYEIHDAYERSLKLPSGKFEIPLVLQTHQLNQDGTRSYIDDIATEFYGNVVAVNGKIWPVAHVEPRKYRVRVVNASNARSYALKLFDIEDNSSGPVFYQIGSDSGFLENPAILNDDNAESTMRLILAPAERADMIIDFSKFAGRTLLLHNSSKDPSDAEVRIPEIMQFKVANSVSEPDTSSLPPKMREIKRIPATSASVTRNVVFDQMTMPNGARMLTLNGRGWKDAIQEKPILGATEIWQLVNPLIDTHPFHIHLVQFQVLDRTLFDVAEFLRSGKINYIADPVPPAPNEMGWKDTVRTLPQMVTRIIMRFAPYTGFYVYHCHILEHEDMEMMRPFEIIDQQ